MSVISNIGVDYNPTDEPRGEPKNKELSPMPGNSRSPKLLTKPRPDITFSTYTMKVPNRDNNFDSMELEVHNKPDPYFSLNNPNDYKYRSKIKSVKLTDNVYAYGIDISGVGSDTEKQSIARFINKVFKDKKTKCIIYNNHLIFNKIPIIGIIIKRPSANNFNGLIYSIDLYSVFDSENGANYDYGVLVRVPVFSDIPIFSPIIQSMVVRTKKLKSDLGIDNITFNSNSNLVIPSPTKLHDFANLYIEKSLNSLGYAVLMSLFVGLEGTSKYYQKLTTAPSKEDIDEFAISHDFTEAIDRISKPPSGDGDSFDDLGAALAIAFMPSIIMLYILDEFIETKYTTIELPENINDSNINELEEARFTVDIETSMVTREMVDENYPITILLDKPQSTYRSLHDAIDLNLQNTIRRSGDVNYIFTALNRLPDMLRLKKSGSIGIIYSLEYNQHDKNNKLFYTKVDKIVGKFDNTHPISRREIIDLYKANESVFIVIQDGSYESIQIDLPVVNRDNTLVKLKEMVDRGEDVRNLGIGVDFTKLQEYVANNIAAIIMGIDLEPPGVGLIDNKHVSSYVHDKYFKMIADAETNDLDATAHSELLSGYADGKYKSIIEKNRNKKTGYSLSLSPIIEYVKRHTKEELSKHSLDIAILPNISSDIFYNAISTLMLSAEDIQKHLPVSKYTGDSRKDVAGDGIIWKNIDYRKNLYFVNYEPNAEHPVINRNSHHGNEYSDGHRTETERNPGRFYYSGLTGVRWLKLTAEGAPTTDMHTMFDIVRSNRIDGNDIALNVFAPISVLTKKLIREHRSFYSQSNRQPHEEVLMSNRFLPNRGFSEINIEPNLVDHHLVSNQDSTISEGFITAAERLSDEKLPINGTYDVSLKIEFNGRYKLYTIMSHNSILSRDRIVINHWNNKDMDVLLDNIVVPNTLNTEYPTDYRLGPILENEYIEFDDGKTDNALKGNPLVRMKLDVESGTLDVNNIEHTTLKVKVHKSLRISYPWSVAAIALGVNLYDISSHGYIDSIVKRYITRNNPEQLPITGLFSRDNQYSEYEPCFSPLSHLEADEYKIFTIDLKPIINYVKKTPIDTLLKQKLELAVLSNLDNRFAYNYIHVASIKGDRTIDKGNLIFGIKVLTHYDYRDTLVLTRANDEAIIQPHLPDKLTQNLDINLDYSGKSNVMWGTRSNLDHGNLTDMTGDYYHIGLYYSLPNYTITKFGPEAKSSIFGYDTYYDSGNRMSGDAAELVKMKNTIGESSTIGDIKSVRVTGTVGKGSQLYLSIEPLFRAYRVGLGFSEIEELDRNPNVDKYGFTIRVWKDKTKAELISSTVVPGVIGGTIKIGPLANNNYIEFNPVGEIAIEEVSSRSTEASRNIGADGVPVTTRNILNPREREKLEFNTIILSSSNR